MPYGTTITVTSPEGPDGAWNSPWNRIPIQPARHLKTRSSQGIPLAAFEVTNIANEFARLTACGNLIQSYQRM
jgi:hypothetical protein